MPTTIVLDVSLSMTRWIPACGDNGHTTEENITYHQLAVRGINQFLNYLTRNSKLEYVSLVVYSTLYEILVDFTRDYEQIKQALLNIEHYDKANVENVLQAATSMMVSNWGRQNLCQILVFTDCGIGVNSTCLERAIFSLRTMVGAAVAGQPPHWTIQLNSIKVNFVCIGDTSEMYFRRAIKLYREFLDLICPLGGGLFALNQDEFGIDMNGECATKKRRFDKNGDFLGDCALTKVTFSDLIEQLCSTNYGRFEATLKCGDYFKLESAVLLWPSPTPLTDGDSTRSIKPYLEICGYLSASDIGSPMSISRHLIIPNNWTSARRIHASRTHENMQDSIRTFYAKIEESEDESSSNHSESAHESICVMLHGALRMENMAALTLLNDNWYGIIYSYADSKKKSNLMLTILPPGHDVIPWLGDLRNLGVVENTTPPSDVLQFPIKPEKRSYSQNCPVWIKQAGLHSDIQKVLRHAKKLPEKTQHFYRELNRIRRAALSMGFIELLDGLANLFQREVIALPPSASPDCAIQLTHASTELTKASNRDLKVVIAPIPNKYNQLL